MQSGTTTRPFFRQPFPLPFSADHDISTNRLTRSWPFAQNRYSHMNSPAVIVVLPSRQFAMHGQLHAEAVV